MAMTSLRIEARIQAMIRRKPAPRMRGANSKMLVRSRLRGSVRMVSPRV